MLTEQEQLEKEIEEEIKLPTIGVGNVHGDASRQQPIVWQSEASKASQEGDDSKMRSDL